MNVEKREKILIILLLVAIIVVIGTCYINLQYKTEIILEDDNTNIKKVAIVEESSEPIEEKNIEKLITVYICGYVKNPDNYTVNEGTRLGEVIEIAGGALDTADLTVINLAHKLVDEEMIYIPKKGESVTNRSSGINTSAAASVSRPIGKININTASVNELDILQGIGPSTAQKIINYRKTNGSFKSIEEIKNVPGIGDAKFEQIKDFIVVN